MSNFDTHGGYFAPQGYVRINEGGTHEENPNEGVQFGVDPNNTPNLLEENESVYKLDDGQDFVYSDRVVISKDMAKQFNLNPWAEGLTYAEYVDKIVDGSGEHPLDPIENNGMRAMLSRAAQAQEAQKIIDEQAQIEQELSELSPEELDQLEAMLAEQEAQGQQVEVSPEEAAMMQQPEAMPMMSYGGTLLRRYDLGGDVDDDIPPTLYRDPNTGDFYAPGYDPGVPASLSLSLENLPQESEPEDYYDGWLDSAVVVGGYPSLDSKKGKALARKMAGKIAAGNMSWNEVPSYYRNYVGGEMAGMSVRDARDQIAQDYIIDPAIAVTPYADAVAKAATGNWSGAAKSALWDTLLASSPKVLGAVSKVIKEGKGAKQAVAAASKGSSFEKKASESLAEKLGRITESDVQAAVGRNTSKVSGSAAETLAKTKATAIAQLDDEAAILKEQLSAATEKLTEAQVRSASKMEIDGIQREIKALERKLKDNADQVAYIGKKPAAPEVKPASSTPEPAPKPVAEKPTATTSQAPAAETLATAEPKTKAPKMGRTPWQKVKRGVGALADITFNPVGITNELGRIPAKGLRGWKYPIGAVELTGRTLGTFGAYNWIKNYPEARALREYMSTPIFETDFEHPFDGDSTAVVWNSEYQEPAFDDYFYADGGPVNKFRAGDPLFRINPASFTVSKSSIPNELHLPGWKIDTRSPEQIAAENAAGEILYTTFTPSFSRTHNVDGTPKFNGLSVELDPNLFPTGKVVAPGEVADEEEQKTMFQMPLATWPRYTGAITAGIAGLHNAFQRPDRLNVPTYSPALSNARMHLRDVVFNPIDQNMAVQDVLSSGAGTASGLMNSGLGPSVGRTLLALDSGIGRNTGLARTQISDANQSRYNQVMSQNNQNASALGQFQYGISRDNAMTQNQIMRDRIQNELFRQRYNNEAESQKYMAIQSQLDALAQALSGIGRENFVMNQINSNTALPYGVGQNGWAYFTGARGGLLKKIK